MIISLKGGSFKWHLNKCCLLPAVHSQAGNAPYQDEILSDSLRQLLSNFLKAHKESCVAKLSKSLSQFAGFGSLQNGFCL